MVNDGTLLSADVGFRIELKAFWGFHFMRDCSHGSWGVLVKRENADFMGNVRMFDWGMGAD